MSKCYDNPEYDNTYSDIQNTWNQHPKVEQEHETKVMKNVHVLPTDKPSRLACDFDKLILNSRLLSPILYKTQNIYITSDEEIKKGEYGLSKLNEIIKFHSGYDYRYYAKIILTTDQELINDGVQAIDDEFLEWFVKNPSCEEVEIMDNREISNEFIELDTMPFEIIIPKKETKYPIGGYAPGNYMCNCSTCKTQFQGDKRAVQCEPCAVKMIQKQHLIDMMKGDEELGLYDEIHPEQIWNEEKKKGIKQLIQDHKKETLEEASIIRYGSDQFLWAKQRDGFVEGAKWQQEFNDTSKVTRVEVIQHSEPYNGRAYTNYNAKEVEIQFQDRGKTLKIFLK